MGRTSRRRTASSTRGATPITTNSPGSMGTSICSRLARTIRKAVTGRRVISATGKTARQARGFTLLELLVVLTLLVLLAAAWPLAGSRLLPAQALRNEAASLSATMGLARSDALVRDSSTVVTVSADGRSYRY